MKKEIKNILIEGLSIVLWAIVFVFILFFFSTKSQAAPRCNIEDIRDCGVSIYLDGWSVHRVDNGNDYNESQNTKGIRIGAFSYIQFTNSFYKPGEALFLSGPVYKRKYFQAGGLVGLVYGYEDTNPQLVFLPYVRSGYKSFWASASCLPSIDGTVQYICVFFLEIKIK